MPPKNDILGRLTRLRGIRAARVPVILLRPHLTNTLINSVVSHCLLQSVASPSMMINWLFLLGLLSKRNVLSSSSPYIRGRAHEIHSYETIVLDVQRIAIKVAECGHWAICDCDLVDSQAKPAAYLSTACPGRTTLVQIICFFQKASKMRTSFKGKCCLESCVLSVKTTGANIEKRCKSSTLTSQIISCNGSPAKLKVFWLV